jgi:DNA invertase Pin-like site-specific DNA recombinase
LSRITISSRKTRKQRRIEEVLEMLADFDTLIVTELSRLGRSQKTTGRHIG